jgi:hypothetical protein
MRPHRASGLQASIPGMAQPAGSPLPAQFVANARGGFTAISTPSWNCRYPRIGSRIGRPLAASMKKSFMSESGGRLTFI